MIKPTAFRLDEVTDRMLDEVAVLLHVTRTDVLRLAVREYHEKISRKKEKKAHA